MEQHHAHGNPYHHIEESRQNGGHYYYDANHNPITGHSPNQNPVTGHSPSHSTQPYHQPQPYSAEMNALPISPYTVYGRPPQPQEWMEQVHGPLPQGPAKKVNPIMMQFTDENGQIDLPKMLSTVNQLANTVQQVTPVIQQIGSLVRLIR